MTAYHGGKQKIGKQIAETIALTTQIMEEHGGFQIKGYCEPFCGMLGVYQHIPELFEDHKPKLRYKAGDINESVIKMWQSSQKGWVPPTTMTKTEYEKLKYSKASAKKGFVGHHCSFGGQAFGTFVPKNCKDSKIVNAGNKVVDIALELDDVKFSHGFYTQFSKLKGYIIYCDPPYVASRCNYFDENHNRLSFNHTEFLEWCRKMSENNLVFISSYSAPEDFKEIMTIKTKVNYGNKLKVNIEKMYFI